VTMCISDILSVEFLECGTICDFGQKLSKFSKILGRPNEITNKVVAAKSLLETAKFSQFGRKRPSSQPWFTASDHHHKPCPVPPRAVAGVTPFPIIDEASRVYPREKAVRQLPRLHLTDCCLFCEILKLVFSRFNASVNRSLGQLFGCLDDCWLTK